jgi:hypothetical protein
MRDSENGGKQQHFFPALERERKRQSGQEQNMVIGPKVKYVVKPEFYVEPEVFHFFSIRLIAC